MAQKFENMSSRLCEITKENGKFLSKQYESNIQFYTYEMDQTVQCKQ